MTRAFFMELRRTFPEFRGPGDTVTNGRCGFFLTEWGSAGPTCLRDYLPVEFGKIECTAWCPGSTAPKPECVS